jgi:hypothetical protein
MNAFPFSTATAVRLFVSSLKPAIKLMAFGLDVEFV